MRACLRLMVAIAATTCAFVVGQMPASAATSDLVVSPHGGAASASFQFTYTLTLSPGDVLCSTETLSLEWDQHMLGQIELDCSIGSVSGVVTPPAQYNAAGPHSICIGPGPTLAPRACRSYVVSGDPPPNATPFASPPECSGTCPTAYPTFEPDCIPTGKPVSPLCVTVTPLSGPFCDDGSHTLNSPPCADAVTSTPTPEPTETAEAETPSPIETITPVTPPNPCVQPGTPTPPCTTPSATTTRTPARNCVATGGSTTTPSACATATITATNSNDGGGGLHVRWGAVGIATAVVGVSGAAGGLWWFRLRG